VHRKVLLDSLFGDLDAAGFAAVITNYLQLYFPVSGEALKPIIPILKSKFRQLQETGAEAELFFKSNYATITQFNGGTLEDARLFGDGYDFQITVAPTFFLAEVKGVRGKSGGLRLTENEFLKAQEYKEDYCLAVVSELESAPCITPIFDPLASLGFSKQTITSEQVYYSLPVRRW
jgi:Domain of unknown function (DUF3883)